MWLYDVISCCGFSGFGIITFSFIAPRRIEVLFLFYLVAVLGSRLQPYFLLLLSFKVALFSVIPSLVPDPLQFSLFCATW